MKTIYLFILSLSFFCCFAQQEPIVYPVAPHDDTRDTLWGVEVADPYRPLETDNEQRQAWLEGQKAVTDKYFHKTHDKIPLETAYQELSSYTTAIAHRSGPYYLKRYREIGDVIDIYYNTDLTSDDRELLLSPTKVSKDLKAFRQCEVSADGHYLAFGYSPDNSDWSQIGVYNIKTHKLLPDHITNVRYSSTYWRGDGFYYIRFDSITSAGRYTDAPYYPAVYYHKVGTNSDTDFLIFQNKKESLNSLSIEVLGNERYVAIHELHHATQSKTIHFTDFKDNLGWQTININPESDVTFIGSDSLLLYALTTSPEEYNGSIVEINPKNLNHWETVVSNQKKGLIRQAIYLNHRIYTIFEHEFLQSIVIFSDSGDVIKNTPLPFGSSTSFVSYCPEKKGILLSENYFFCPPIGNLLSIKNDSVTLVSMTKVSFNPLKYKMHITSYLSEDSTSIPIYIVTNEDYKKDGPAPTLLKIYGGFGNTLEPSYDPGIVLFLSSGGVFAYANVRGGRNYIKDWHTSGTLLNKQNTFTDTYYAAKFLVDRGYAQKDKMALTGGSNGGLVCAAVTNQHPDYFRAIISNVGVYDMIRGEKFTVMAYHTIAEFGSVKNPVQFKNLFSYSPLHNIRQETQYPSMLILTGDHDDRVPPFHSYKYVAALQKYTHSKKPILLIVEKNAGHSGTASFDDLTTKNKLAYSFLFKELGMKFNSDEIH